MISALSNIDQDQLKKVSTKMLAITRCVFLQKNDAQEMREFNSNHFSWWYSSKFDKYSFDLSIIVCKLLGLAWGRDYEIVNKTIEDSLYESAQNRHLFYTDDIFLKQKKTLFDCKAVEDATKFGYYLAVGLIIKMKESLLDWCVLYTAPRISGESFSIASENLHIINRYDKTKWDSLLNKGFRVDFIDPESMNYINGEPSKLSRYNYDYIFVCEEKGTLQGSNFTASVKLRMLFSVVTAISEEHPRIRCMEEPHSLSLQLAHSSNSSHSITTRVIGKLYPYFGEQLIITQQRVQKVKLWYEQLRKLSKEEQDKISKCAHFINKGMMSSEIEAFIHFFVSLDALFGKQGEVEKSIKIGVSKLPKEGGWDKKIKALFKLRSDLVHGGSRFIEEWDGYLNYKCEHKSEPRQDVESLAYLALAKWPSIALSLK
ncbi:HEPN domain-containing protein [Pseudoalteromonas luteoviolacea]|uniref:Uncharacterized protein n=1 Tax=Pseudoalteromonas luteoviolacea DSM 6061 TaxID=1365250 RepID=A0A166X8W3_9GAMM|nr:HEPN domain-containing protein [Pseudoalteromonas luteoviolacea]KZN39816.1 hypothetical protein N475_13745 [Pseudoalteromonas luteoviolacea DSM 6061]MBE0385755.1 hypothetical protein [Pseudoalteromonas luteoviolacea DSM 6061]